MTTQVERPIAAKPSPTFGEQVGNFARRNGLQIGIIGVLVLMWIFLFFAAPITFRSPEIYAAFMSTVPFFGVIALPLTLLVVADEIDLSFGSIMAIAMVGYLSVYNATNNAWLALLVCLIVGAIAGLINGLLVVRLGIPSLIATIGTQFFWRGVSLVVTNAKGGSLGGVADSSPAFHFLLVGRIFDYIPMQMVWMIIIGIAMWVLLNRHRFGAHLYLIGDNTNSARLMGINVNQRRVLIFVIVGIFAAFGGLLASLEVSYYWPTLGEGYLLQTLAAVFLGGTPVTGGVGTILGTFVGCFIIGGINAATVAVGLTGFWTQLIYGLIIVVSVAMHNVLRRRIN